METKKGYGKFNGCLPSPPDARDYSISRLVPKAPIFIPEEHVVLRPAAIKNQGEIGSCVGHALASAREIGEALQKHICELSPGYIYANREAHTYFDEGMIPREAIASLKKSGVPKLQLFPYNDTYPSLKKKLDEKKEACDLDAEPHRITAYAQVYSIMDIKTALLELGAVPVSYSLYNSFYSVSSDGIVPIPNRTKEYWIGNHMMLIIGWKKIGGVERWIVLNSWGQRWGDNGLCYIPTKGYDINEAWSLTDEVYPAREITFKSIRFSVKPELSRRVTLDDIMFELPVGIQMKNGRIMVPLRFFSESLGCYVRWEGAEKKITIIFESDGRTTEIIMILNEKSYTVNGEEKEMDVEPFLAKSGFTLVPLRFVAENLDCQVAWDASTQEATVKHNI